MNSARHYLGLISGTSADGLDAALIRVAEDQRVEIVCATTVPLAAGLLADIRSLIGDGGGPLDLLGRADVAFGQAAATACERLIEKSGIDRDAIAAIGCHGQTVRHGLAGDPPFTLQIGDPNVIAARTGLTVVADFRRRDVAEGGQGAPLAPLFHAATLAAPDEQRVVLNLGGIANLTVLAGDAGGVVRGDKDATGSIRGFDTGPANALLDAWYGAHHDGDFDRGGEWARGGTVIQALLARLLDHAYFHAAPPKSTGKEDFNLDFVTTHVAGCDDEPNARDVQATLTELSAVSVANDIRSEAPAARRVLVCGGGVHNGFLMQRLRANLPAVTVESTAAHGIDPDHVEAALFAWLACRRLANQPGAFASVTGARRDSVLGAVYPGARRG